MRPDSYQKFSYFLIIIIIIITINILTWPK